MSSCAPWLAPSPLKLPHHQSNARKARPAPPPPFRCSAAARPAENSAAAAPAPAPPRLVLHDSLDAAGIPTAHARAAREGFAEQIGRLTDIDGASSIAISRGADLARAALHVAAEDDSLVSHSSVPLPVDAFIDRLDDLSMGFCSLYLPPSRAPPEVFLSNLERYFYVHKGFHRADVMSDSRGLYLHSALTCRSGSAVMLSLIYSEMLKMLRIYGLLDFDAEIYFPRDLDSLPRGYLKQQSKLSDQPHIITSKLLLVEMLRNLKDAFWPFQYDHPNSLFLKAAHAANRIHGPSIRGENYSDSYRSASGLEIASAKAAQHRLGRGIWTNVRFGDMRCALAACERLIILTADCQELRDYAVLLYHCGFYEECLQYFKLYQTSRDGYAQERPWSSQKDELEEDAVEKLMARVTLVLAEKGWNECAFRKSYWSNSQEPW